LETASGESLITDGVIASSVAQANRLWALREAVNEGQARIGPFLRSDVSVRLSDLPRFVEETCAVIETEVPGAKAVAYGHFGDGNVHLNVLPPEDMAVDQVGEFLERSKVVLNDRVDAFGGSISAEHGIGRLKRGDFQARLSGTDRMLLEGLKSTFDPAGRMNPGCIF
jgi:FAD/FMN-containing dehydrogenase